MGTVRETKFAGYDWLVLSGSRRDVFTELGRRYSSAIHRLRASMGQWEDLERRSASGRGSRVFDAVVKATQSLCPQEAEELECLADGARISARELWSYNLRGDVGSDGTGCSDICVGTDGDSVLAHNEDGDAALAGVVGLVTLKIDSDPGCTVLWYPGFLPSNSFVATSAGLVWGVDHVPVAVPGAGAGRHFAARRAQKSADFEEALRVLARIPCAGGFSFTVGDARTGRIALVENAAGQFARVDVASAGRVAWHTNHIRHLDTTAAALAVGGADLAESKTRGEIIEGLLAGSHGAAEVLKILRAPGVLKTGTTSGSTRTLGTMVADLARDELTVQGDEGPHGCRLADFSVGKLSPAG